MSSYIIAGSADSLDTAYCEEIARRIKAKYKNIDFRIVIKHPSQWEDYLQQICRIYGFLNKSNPIIYTYHGKIIGNKQSFVESTTKYFGLGEQMLIVPNLTTQINMKQAQEQIKHKKIVKNNIRTLQQKIQEKYNKLLKSGENKHLHKDIEQFLVNGIQYQLIKIPQQSPKIEFPINQQIQISDEVIEPENIDLAKLAAIDQIPEQTGKQAFVTNNQQINTQSIQKMSEASRTNRLHSSVMSRDGDSKINKQSNKEKQQIDQEFDDVADFNDHSMENLVISQIGDNFYLAFQKQKNSYIPAEMLIYLNESQNNGNVIRIYNGGRAVIGHRTLIKQIHYEVNQEQILNSQVDNDGQKKQQDQNHAPSIQNIQESTKQKQEQIKASDQKVEQEEFKNQKSKTQPNVHENILQNQQKKNNKQEQVISEAHSDLNLVSNLNYHTLYILRPLSQQQIKRILYIVNETATIACLQFLPQNPNPKIKVYNRQNLLGIKNSLFPIQKFIEKQIEDEEYQIIKLPKEDVEGEEKYQYKTINQLNFNHFYFEHDNQLNDEKLVKILKFGIDELLNIQETLKKQIGYNLIFSKKYTMIIALTEPYKVYGGTPFYYDGLSYLGYVYVVEAEEAYQMKKKHINSGSNLRESLAKCSGFQLCD